jgi:glycosyltransferase involved in cell wall biosynthesis
MVDKHRQENKKEIAMKILHVVDMISQYKAGGSAKVPFQLGEAQARLGHDVTIYTSDYEAENQVAPKGVQLVKYHCVINLLGGIRVTPGMLFADFKQFDIMHLHNYRTLVNVIAVSKGIPFVIQAHGSATKLRARISRPLYKMLWNSNIMSRAKAFIADTEMEIEHYLDQGAPRKKIYLVPVGIDSNEYKRLPVRKNNRKKRVLFLGRFHPIKAPDLLAKAFSLLDRDDTELIIAGIDYGFELELRQLIRKLDIKNVQYLGPVYDAEKIIEYTNADVYVMPSRYEMFGLTLLEALACGTPVIITDRCGVAPLLPTECGQVVPFDEYTLAEAINKALDSHAADVYRSYRIKWAMQYSWSKIAPKVIDICKKCLTYPVD